MKRISVYVRMKIYVYISFVFCRIQLCIARVFKTRVSQSKHDKQKSLGASVNMYAVEQIITVQCVHFMLTFLHWSKCFQKVCRFPRSASFEFPALHLKNKKSSFIHTHTHTVTHAHIHNTHTHAHIHAHTYTHIHTYIHAQTHTHTLTHTRPHVCSHVHTHGRTHTRTYTYTHTRAHIHTHTITRPEIHIYIIPIFTCLQIPWIHKFVKMTVRCGISYKIIKCTRYTK